MLFLIGKVGGWFTSLGLLYTCEPPLHRVWASLQEMYLKLAMLALSDRDLLDCPQHKFVHSDLSMRL